jgi:hypothetical protein
VVGGEPTGARQAGRATEALYALLGCPDYARFDEIAGQGHGYCQPYRERMYGWMMCHLQGEGRGETVSEGTQEVLSENDRRLLCDPDRTLMRVSPTVVELARARAHELVAARNREPSTEGREKISQWVRERIRPSLNGSELP